ARRRPHVFNYRVCIGDCEGTVAKRISAGKRRPWRGDNDAALLRGLALLPPPRTGTRLEGVTNEAVSPGGTTPTPRRLRSNFTPGSTPWAMRRAQWTALGLTPEDMNKPKIAIVNTSSQLASCFSHLDAIVAPLKAAIAEAGGVAFEVRTAAPSDAITSAGASGAYILPARDLIASDIEVAVEGALLDGMVCLAS